MRYLITGATGFVGGHVAEACRRRGIALCTIARVGSETGLLESLGATIHRGDIADKQFLQKALDGVDGVIHCAAKVGDWGPLEDYRAINVEALRRILDTCQGLPLKRFIHMSSLGVYEARHHYGTDETEPLPTHHLDAYTQTKVEAEHLVLLSHRLHAIPAVILRPGFVYGPRDKAVLPKLIERLRVGRMNYLGGDQRLLNTIFVGNLVDAVLLAIDNPKAVGQVYNLTDGEQVTKQHFVDAVAEAMGYRKPKQILPRWLAALLAKFLLRQIRRAGMTGKPWLTAAQYKFLVLNLDFSIDKAKRELGYAPRIGFDQAMRETMAWYKAKA